MNQHKNHNKDIAAEVAAVAVASLKSYSSSKSGFNSLAAAKASGVVVAEVVKISRSTSGGFMLVPLS